MRNDAHDTRVKTILANTSEKESTNVVSFADFKARKTVKGPTETFAPLALAA